MTKKPQPAGKLKVKIFSPYEVFFEGEAVSFSARNKTGPFDVLPGHANFFSLVEAGETVVNTGKEKLSFKISHSILNVHNNLVKLFVQL